MAHDKQHLLASSGDTHRSRRSHQCCLACVCSAVSRTRAKSSVILRAGIRKVKSAGIGLRKVLSTSRDVSSPDGHKVPSDNRLLLRDASFSQAVGYFRIANRNMRGGAQRLLCTDWFHSLLNFPCGVITAMVFFLYVCAIFLFALCYLLCSNECLIGADTFLDAYYFSLTTMMTIGFGTQDQFFDGCWQALVLIVVQSLLGMFLDVLCFGFIYTRLANPSNRATTVCFSDKAVLREINGQFYFMCQALEMRRHHLVEASVRMYAMRTLPRGTSKTPLAPLDDTQYGMPKGVSPSSSAALPPNTPTPFFVQQCGMRLQQPDDELGSSVFLALPCILVHRIDAFSPLHPDFDSRHRTRRVDHRSTGSQHHPDGLRSRRFSRTEATVSTQYRFPRVVQRSVDCQIGSRDSVACSVCGDSFPSPELLARHVAYNCASDVVSGHDPKTVCGICGNAYVTVSHLERHFQEEHALPDGSGSAEEPPPLPRPTLGTPRSAVSTPRARGEEGSARPLPTPYRGLSSTDAANHSAYSHIVRARVQAAQQPSPASSLELEADAMAEEKTFDVNSEKDGQSVPPLPEQQKLRTHAAAAAAATRDPARAAALRRQRAVQDERRRINDFLAQTHIEVVIIIEGTDPPTSCCLQARHSYLTQTSEVEWDKSFVPLVSRCSVTGEAVVDFSRFHALEDAPPENVDLVMQSAL